MKRLAASFSTSGLIFLIKYSELNFMHDLTSYGENVAAIAAAIHGSDYDAIYARCSENIGGFVGIWNLCAIAAQAFSNMEAPYTAGEDYYWIEAIDDYAAVLCDCLLAGNIPCAQSLHAFAANSIEKCRIEP